MKIVNRTGEIRISNEGYRMTVIQSLSSQNNTIMFDDGLKLYNIRWDKVESGQIKNPNHRSVCGIGYRGVGKFEPKIYKEHYNCWLGMIKRCYNLKELSRCPTYKDCIICDDWQCFQNFAQWYETNWKPHMKGWQLDKDILVKNNKIYSPETCELVHSKINSLFTNRKNTKRNIPLGVTKKGKKFSAQITKKGKRIWIGIFDTVEDAFTAYKIEKEKHIKEIAEEFKNEIPERLYIALLNYQVEITD